MFIGPFVCLVALIVISMPTYDPMSTKRHGETLWYQKLDIGPKSHPEEF